MCVVHDPVPGLHINSNLYRDQERERESGCVYMD